MNVQEVSPVLLHASKIGAWESYRGHKSPYAEDNYLPSEDFFWRSFQAGKFMGYFKDLPTNDTRRGFQYWKESLEYSAQKTPGV